MEIVTILGSPRKQGNTAAVLSQVERLLAADAVVYTSPVYCWAFAAQMKALMDRHYCLVKWQDGKVVNELFRGKLVTLLVTCGGPAEENVDLIYPMFDREMDYLGGRVVGKYVVADCTTPEELGARGQQVAEQMARDLQAAADSLANGDNPGGKSRG